MKHYDIIVVGGGFAGAAASIASKNKEKIKDIDTNELRKALKDANAVV